MGARHKKKVGKVDFDRAGRIGKYYHVKPSSYFPQLTVDEALLFDEACIVAMEKNNKIIEAKRKVKEKEKENQKAFQEGTSSLFENESGII